MDHYLHLEAISKKDKAAENSGEVLGRFVKHFFEWMNDDRMLKWFENNLESVRSQPGVCSSSEENGSPIRCNVSYIVTRKELQKLICDCVTAFEHKDLDRIAVINATAEKPEDKELKEIRLQIRREVEKILPELRRKTDCWTNLQDTVNRLQAMLDGIDWDNEILEFSHGDVEIICRLPRRTDDPC